MPNKAIKTIKHNQLFMQDIGEASQRKKDIEQLKEKRLDELIEEKVEQKTEKLEKQNQKLREKLEKLETKNKQPTKNNNKDSQNEGISRRDFLKKAGLGTAGLAALMTPASALNIDSNSFSVRTGSETENLEEYFSVGEDGPVNIENTDLLLNDNDIDDIKNLGSGEGQYINLQAGSEDNIISLNYGSGEEVRLYNYSSGNTVLETNGDDVVVPGGSLEVEGSVESSDTPVYYAPGFTQWSSDLDGGSVTRFQADNGEKIVVERLDVSKQDGEADSDFTVEVTDASTGEQLASAEAGETANGGEAEQGNDVTVDVTNNASEEIIASIIVAGRVIQE